jgi:hypothetical protein
MAAAGSVTPATAIMVRVMDRVPMVHTMAGTVIIIIRAAVCTFTTVTDANTGGTATNKAIGRVASNIEATAINVAALTGAVLVSVIGRVALLADTVLLTDTVVAVYRPRVGPEARKPLRRKRAALRSQEQIRAFAAAENDLATAAAAVDRAAAGVADAAEVVVTAAAGVGTIDNARLVPLNPPLGIYDRAGAAMIPGGRIIPRIAE